MKRILDKIIIVLAILLCLNITSCDNNRFNVDGIIYGICDDDKSYEVLNVKDESTTSITIPSEVKGLPVTKIEEGAFANCKNLKSITLPFVGHELNESENSHFGYIFGAPESRDNERYVPKTLTDVVITGSEYIGDNAFGGCIYIKTIKVADSVKIIGKNAFSTCTSLTYFIVPANVKVISEKAFSFCYNIQKISLSDKVVSVENNAFLDCRNLKEIKVPTSLKSISTNAFSKCDKLTTLYYRGSETEYTASGIGAYLPEGITVYYNWKH